MNMMHKFLMKRVILALIFMPILIGLFTVTLVKSISTFYSLASVNDQISVLTKGAYQSNVAMGHLIYATLFQFTPSMLLENKPPYDQVNETISDLSNLNIRLINKFLNEPEEVDPLIKDVLQSNTCDYLNPQSMALCYYSTNGQKMGLLSINTDYYNTIYGVKTAMKTRSSYSTLITLLGKVLEKVVGEMTALEDIYPFLIQHVVDKFTDTTDSAKSDEIKFFVVICLVIAMFAGYIFWKPLKDMRKADIGRRKILKIIPLHILQENKGFKFYLMQDFKREIDDIRSIM